MAAVSDEIIQESFYPYADGVPSFPGLEVGMTIDQSNVEQFKDVLDPAMYMFVKEGATTVKVGPTTDFALHDSYVEATRQYSGDVTIGEGHGLCWDFCWSFRLLWLRSGAVSWGGAILGDGTGCHCVSRYRNIYPYVFV